MQSWLATKLMAYLMKRLRAGDARLLLWLDAPDVTLTFPGQNSWSGRHEGKEAVARWLGRFIASGIQIFADEVVATGWPWGTRLVIRGRDVLVDADGAVVYENRYVIWGRLRWGRLKEYEVYEDTHAANMFDAWLDEHRPELLAAA
jgi:ketosteroid isomerase-like protein